MTRTIEVRTERESILVEQALAMVRELALVADAAPDGQVLAVSKLAALRDGRELTRVAVQAALNRQWVQPTAHSSKEIGSNRLQNNGLCQTNCSSNHQDVDTPDL